MREHEYSGGNLEQQTSLDALFDDICVANELLSKGDLSDEDVADLIKEFDARWPYMGSEIIIFGPCYMPVASQDKTDMADDNLERFLLTDLRKRTALGGYPVWSHGFTVSPQGNEIVLLINDPNLCEDVASSNFQTIKFINFGFARIDEIKVLPGVDSLDQQDRKMRFVYGELMEAIDIAALNAHSVAEALRRIGAIRHQYLEDEEDAETLVAMGGYIHRLFEFATDIPYIIKTFNGQDHAQYIAFVIAIDWMAWGDGDVVKWLSPFMRVKSMSETGDLIEGLIDPKAVVGITHLKDLHTR